MRIMLTLVLLLMFGGADAVADTVARQLPERMPTFSSEDPEATALDWGMDAFCASMDASYDWTRMECKEPAPET